LGLGSTLYEESKTILNVYQEKIVSLEKNLYSFESEEALEVPD